MKIWLNIGLIFLTINTSAQHLNPVSWNFSAKKLSSGVYEISMAASIQKGWHLYSQKQPIDAIAIPTTFNINKNPLLLLKGKIKEQGVLEKFEDVKLGLSAFQYSEKVNFVQQVTVRGKAKTNFSGTVEFQPCDDKKCLPPKTIAFNIALK